MDMEPCTEEGEYSYQIKVVLRGYGKPSQLEREYRKTISRMMKLEFGEQVITASIEPLEDVDLRN